MDENPDNTFLLIVYPACFASSSELLSKVGVFFLLEKIRTNEIVAIATVVGGYYKLSCSAKVLW